MKKNAKKLKYYEKAYNEYNEKIYLEEYFRIKYDDVIKNDNTEEEVNKMNTFYLFKKNKTLLLQTAEFFMTLLVIFSGIMLYSAAEKKIAGSGEYTPGVFTAAERDLNALETIAAVQYIEQRPEIKTEISTTERQNVLRIVKKYNMKYINQNKINMPNGCEVVSLAMALSRYLPDITAGELADKYLPRSALPVYHEGVYIAEDPTFYFIGDPTGRGFGIFAPGLTNTANAALKAYKMNLTAVDISGCTEEELFGYVSDGYPVVVWITMRLAQVNWGSTATWHLPNWRLFRWPSPMHCAVLVDFTETLVTLYDPTAGVVNYDKELFLQRWNEIGPYPDNTGHALVIK